MVPSKNLLVSPVLLASILSVTTEQMAMGADNQLQQIQRLDAIRADLQSVARSSQRGAIDQSKLSRFRIAQWRNH
ncbi:MAG TPA: hypothetical protein VKN18_01615 [Blastocatellia bacterium]|nr:hypothetical protein [Blastocatellia bacterium]